MEEIPIVEEVTVNEPKPHGFFYQRYIKPRLEEPEFKEKRDKIKLQCNYKKYHEDEEHRKAQIEYAKKYYQENKEKLREYYKKRNLKNKALKESINISIAVC
jgi:hypothetical protein